ncbi:hypothetical protein PEC301619_35590 [Pectobacterium carotovorum subsp. carotovorum]|nr:hypothetical protein PEC301619_35590 [Pectobacterium carotovorum subsp. carotovorum]GKW08818.1 hypothetical protein PEC301889_33000 [Pectobacterium carotovorum subsp. carotovorum]
MLNLIRVTNKIIESFQWVVMLCESNGLVVYNLVFCLVYSGLSRVKILVFIIFDEITRYFYLLAS